MSSLTYTQEMKEQDALWEKEQEDRDKMKELHAEIIKEAKEKGYVFEYTTYLFEGFTGEVITELYDDLAEKEQVALGKLDLDGESMPATCKGLIHAIETIYGDTLKG